MCVAVDTTQLVMHLYSATGVQAIAAEEWQGTVSLFTATRDEAQRLYDYLVGEEKTVSSPVAINDRFSVTVLP